MSGFARRSLSRSGIGCTILLEENLIQTGGAQT
jgi:hypothetical protein